MPALGGDIWRIARPCGPRLRTAPPLSNIRGAALASYMMMMSLEPAVVKWIVDSSGMAHDYLAKRLKVDVATLDGWIRTGRMEYGKIDAMARCVKRPATLFLLKEPPEEEDIPDFRAMEGAAGGLGPEDRITVRRARYAQYVAGEMMGVLGGDPKPAIGGEAAVEDPPEEIAQRESKALGLPGRGERAARGDARGFYEGLRDSVEGRNVLVFQDAMDAGAVRVVSLTCEAPRVILVNSRGADETKALALLHGYGHVLLGRGGICREQAEARPVCTRDQRAEEWCSRFAAAVLMPRGPFADELGRLEGERLDARAAVKGLAEKFRTSGYAAAIRAAGVLGGARGRAYEKLAGELANKPGAKAPARAGGGRRRGLAGHVDGRISQLGRKFVGLVLDSYEKKEITSHDFIEYLKTDLKHLDGFRRRVRMDG